MRRRASGFVAPQQAGARASGTTYDGGSQRDGAEETGVHGHHISYGTEVARPSQENTATGNSQAVTSNAPPTIDSVVTPELQQEIDLAISDSQIDQLLNSPAAIANDALAEGERVEGKVHSVSEEHVLIDLARHYLLRSCWASARITAA